MGRVVTTMITLFLGPWTLFGGFQMANPFFLWYLFGYMIAAVLVLKQCWTAIPVSRSDDDPNSASQRGRVRRRFPILFERVTVPRTATIGCVCLILVSVALVVWFRGDSLARYSLVAIGIMSVVGMLLAWLSDI
jgi:hypothetical protein